MVMLGGTEGASPAVTELIVLCRELPQLEGLWELGGTECNEIGEEGVLGTFDSRTVALQKPF